MRTSLTNLSVLALFTGALAHPAAAGGLAGTVRDAATGQPAAGILVKAYNSNAVEVCSDWTSTAGSYSCDPLPAGTYYVATAVLRWSSVGGYLDELYLGVPCPLGTCDVTSGTPVHVTADATTTGIDFALSPGGRIRGTVTDAATGLPVAGVYVTISSGTRGGVTTTKATDSSGVYTTRAVLPTGSFFVQTENYGGYFDELYDGVSCPSYECAVTGGTPVAVTAGATTSGIDFALAPGGRISGRVTDDLTGHPLAGVDVQVYDWTGSLATTGRTDGTGAFTSVNGLRSRTYYARTVNAQGYADELYDDLPCTTCVATRGKPIHVTAGATTSGIAFALRPGGRISGHVRLGRTPPPYEEYMTVQVYDASGRGVGSVEVDPSGSYTAGGWLASGSYYARATASGYVSELYGGIPCPSEECGVTRGTPIVVTAGTTTSPVDFDLGPGERISGTVTDAGTGLPVPQVQVYVYDSEGHDIASSTSDASGHWATWGGVPPGTYYAVASPEFTPDYLGELYDDIPCPHGSWSCTVTSGTPITVTAGTPTTGIDFALTKGGVISGTVTDAGSGLALAGTRVDVWGSAGVTLLPVASAQADSSGHYATPAVLPTGTYYATAWVAGHVGELYEGIPCAGDQCREAAGTPISVTAGATKTGIDFAVPAGGGIGGTVRDARTGLPLDRVEVRVYDSAGRYAARATTDSSGSYAVDTVLPSGTYFAWTRNYQGYVDELWDDIVCPSYTCPVTSGTPIGVTAGATTSGIDFTLAGRGRIAGTVRDAATGRPLPDAEVRVYHADGSFADSVRTAVDGTWVTGENLPTGTYYARTSETPGHVDELYDDVACPSETCPVTTGRAIAVTAGATTRGIDFLLARGGQIGGMVTDAASGLPLAGVLVHIHDAGGTGVSWGETNALGVYTSTGGPGLLTGTYYVGTYNSLGYVDALYAGMPCPGGSCPVTAGTPVHVTTGATTEGVDFHLAAGGRISSVVRDAATGRPLEGVQVWVHDGSGRQLTGGSTNSWGVFTSVRALPAGTYYARTANTLGYADELYDDVPCPGGACTVTSGTPIVVAVGTLAPSIAFALAVGGEIAGHVTDSGTDQPVARATVRVHDSTGRLVTSGTTDAAGAWTASESLPAGTYYARTENAPGHLDELYDGIPCPLGVCTVTSGTAIDVTAGALTPGIDFALDLSPGSSFYTVSPCRLLDTRDPAGATAGQPLAAGTERTLNAAGACGIPPTAKAVALNVTATQASQPGNVRLYPAGAPAPPTSNVNYTPRVTRAGNAVVSLNASGELAVLASPGGTVHLVLDVSGYYE